MHFSIKNIKGLKYHYISDFIYIAKGKSKLKNKSLGRIDNPLEEKWIQIESFQREIIRKEVEERNKYWTSKIQNKKGFLYGTLDKLERLRSSLERGKKDLKEFGKLGMEAAFKTDFIYNSNKIEGSRVPRKTIEEIIKTGKRSNAEVKNSLAALEYMQEMKRITSIRKIIELHKILLAHEPEKHGLRKEPILVGNSETLSFEEIPEALINLLDWLNKKNHNLYPPELAFGFYYRFERIHPFKDGNGRIGRILMNAILKEHRYHPIIIWDNNRVAHMHAFEKAIEGGMHKYLMFMNEQMDRTYKIYLQKTQKANQMEKEIEDIFFTPSR